MKLVLLGPPGAGKGTQAELLKSDLKIIHISTGDIFREEMKKGTPLGQELKSYVDHGKLVPDEVVTKIVANRLKAVDPKQGYLLDGFPRTVTQAQDLDKILNEIKQPLDYVISMEATLPVILFRLTGRRVCKACGALYHTKNRPPKKEGVCDQCQGPLYQRADDNEATIKTRMSEYATNTAPIVEYYRKQRKLLPVNSDQDAPEVQVILLKKFADDGKFDYAQNKTRA